jgi:hypothetical protein
MGMTHREHVIRGVIITLVMVAGLFLWIRECRYSGANDRADKFWKSAPVSALASLLSYEEISRVAPWLADLIEKSPLIAALVQTTLPSTAVIIFNAALPYLLEWLCYIQGFRSKSEISTSILKK